MNSCSLHIFPSLVKYLLWGLDIPVTHRDVHKQSPLTLLQCSQAFTPESHCFELTALLHWVQLRGVWSKEKREKKLTVKCFRGQTHGYRLATPALWTVFFCLCFFYRESFCGQNEDGLVISSACHQVVVFGKQYKWVKYSRTLSLWCRCDVRTCTELNETVSVCHVWPTASTLVQASQGWGQWHSLTSFPSLTASCWTTFYEGDWLNECVCFCSYVQYVCIVVCPEGVVTLCWKTAQKRQNLVFVNLISLLADTSTYWNWQLKVGKMVPTQRQQMKLGKQDYFQQHWI